MPSSSTYLDYRQRAGRFVPFAPPLPSPKHTGPLTLKQRLHWHLWRFGLPLWMATVGKRYRSRRPIMLIGVHNSGTTILGNLLGKHTDLLNWSEAPEVWTPDDAFLSWGNLDRPAQAQPFLFDPMSYQRTVAAHGEFVATIQASFSLYATSRLRRRFTNKNPHMAISVPYIEAAFPDACYVHIRRNGYAVVQSLLSNWRPVLENVQRGEGGHWQSLKNAIDPIYFDDPLALVRRCAAYWRELDESARTDLAALSPERVYSTTYERLCADTETVLREIFTQFDLNPARFRWGQLQNPTRYPWTEMLPMENRNFKYRERLSAQEIAVITETVGDTLAEFGYLHG